MSIYNFSPLPSTTEENLYATWHGAFSLEEIDWIVQYCEENLTINNATIAGKDSGLVTDGEIRKSKTGWVSYNQDTAWLYDRLAYVTRMLNTQNWKFDLQGFVEDFQFTLYDEENSHYTWHVDAFHGGKVEGRSPRKLSLVVQLSNPYEYEGGELQLMTSSKETVIQKEKGLITAFPSYTLHRVTPVTSGIRKSLVIWVSGPPFK